MTNGLPRESVWDYPRPAIGQAFHGTLRVHLPNHKLLAMTQSGYRILETSHPPSYYFPKEHVLVPVIFNGLAAVETATPASGIFLRENHYATHCEWKGTASYFDLIAEQEVVANVAWCYKKPCPGFENIKNYLSFYASRVGECWVNDELIDPQQGEFYGGWVTSNLSGPFKGSPGTEGW